LLNNILSLKLVVSVLLVVTHGSLLFPSLLELPFVIHNLISLCLHFRVLNGHKQVQVLAVALLLSKSVGDLGIMLVLDLVFQIVQDCVFLQPVLIYLVFNHVVGLLRPKVRLLV